MGVYSTKVLTAQYEKRLFPIDVRRCGNQTRKYLLRQIQLDNPFQTSLLFGVLKQPSEIGFLSVFVWSQEIKCWMGNFQQQNSFNSSGIIIQSFSPCSDSVFSRRQYVKNALVEYFYVLGKCEQDRSVVRYFGERSSIP